MPLVALPGVAGSFARQRAALRESLTKVLLLLLLLLLLLQQLLLLLLLLLILIQILLIIIRIMKYIRI